LKYFLFQTTLVYFFFIFEKIRFILCNYIRGIIRAISNFRVIIQGLFIKSVSLINLINAFRRLTFWILFSQSR